jgi:hypothetical protein
VGHVTEPHGNQPGPAGEAFGSLFSLMFGYEFDKFDPRKEMKQLTKQTRYHYLERALYGNFDGNFVSAKILHNE